MAVKKGKKLAAGRPPLLKHTQAAKSMNSKTSKTIINTHHRLQKDHALALKSGNVAKAQELEHQIQKNGGIQKYQAASIQGQASDRGGDSSKVLVKWLNEHDIIKSLTEVKSDKPPYRVLEVGALSTKNDISRFPHTFEVTRIDLNSQGPGIEKQDFMERPLPSSSDERFDVISLSLVLNYVPVPSQRGEMLKRVCQFLRSKADAPDSEKAALPALFLVLPLPCVTNSRYLDEPRLKEIMESLGFVLTHRKTSSKLYYVLYRWDGPQKGKKFKKETVRNGPGMNNFCIVVD